MWGKSMVEVGLYWSSTKKKADKTGGLALMFGERLQRLWDRVSTRTSSKMT